MRFRLGMSTLLALAACHHGRWSGDKSATELHLGELTIAIPDGWRSMAELSGSGDLAKYAPREHSAGMMPGKDRDGVITASVLFDLRAFTADQPAWTTCAEAVPHGRDTIGPISQVHDGGSACSWHMAMGKLDVTVGVRKVGDRGLAVTCLIDASHDPEAQAVCADIFSSLQLP